MNIKKLTTYFKKLFLTTDKLLLLKIIYKSNNVIVNYIKYCSSMYKYMKQKNNGYIQFLKYLYV